ncbi:hypothetical protein LNP15_02865 [Fructobacillus sp. M131]|nr:hypothetical protein [Fructobacillus cardui]
MNNYGRIDPSLPNRIMELAEKQTSHRINIEERSMNLNERNVNANILLAKTGLYLGFIIIVFALLCALVMILKGQYTGGIFSIIGILATLAATWYKVNRDNRKN